MIFFRCLLIENFIPINFVQKIKSCAIFDSDEEKWIINDQTIKNSVLQNELTNNIKLDYQKSEMINSELEINNESAIFVANKSLKNNKFDNITNVNIVQTTPELTNYFFNEKINSIESSLLKRPVSLFIFIFFVYL